MRWRFDLLLFTLARLIRRERYAIVHTHNPRTALVGALAAALGGRSAGASCPYANASGIRRPVDESLERQAAERRSLAGAAGLIGVSESIGRYLRTHGYQRQHIWIVPNGTPVSDTLPFRPKPSGTWTVGVVALFRPAQGAGSRAGSNGQAPRCRHSRSAAVGQFESSGYENEVRQYASRLGVAAMID